MPDYPELLILRHGETEWNREGRMQGVLDSRLTDTGRAQAEAQRALLRAHGTDGFTWYSSPQGRAMHTAEIAGCESGSILADHRLSEIAMGDWTGMLRAEIIAQVPHFFAADAPPLAWYGHAPGGETLDDLAERVRDFLDHLTSPAVIVTHGITSRMLRSVALGLPPAAFAWLEGGQGVAYHIAPGLYRRLTTAGVEPQKMPAVRLEL